MIEIPLRNVDLTVELEIVSTNGIGDMVDLEGDFAGLHIATCARTRDVLSYDDRQDYDKILGRKVKVRLV